MDGFIKNKNPSQYVDWYIIGKKTKNPLTNTQELEKTLCSYALSDKDTDVYGCVLVLVDLKLKRAYSTTFLNKITYNFRKTIYDNAKISANNYNRYNNFIKKYCDKLYRQILKQESTQKSQPELMEDDYYYHLVESFEILTVIQNDLKKAYQYLISNRENKSKGVE